MVMNILEIIYLIYNFFFKIQKQINVIDILELI